MSLKIGSTPNSQWQLLQPLLKSFGWRGSQFTDSESCFRNEVTSNQGARYVLLVSRPEVAISMAIEGGEDPQSALKQWLTTKKSLLEFYKANRRNALILEVEDAAQNTQAFINVLEGHLGLRLEGAAPHIQYVQSEPNIHQILAHQLVTQAEELVASLSELEACITPLSDDAFQVPTFDILGLYMQQQNHYTKESSELKEENELLLLQLSQVQEELEKYYIINKELTKKSNDQLQVNSEKINELESLRNEVEPLRVRVDISTQRIERLTWAKSELLDAKLLYDEALIHLELSNKHDPVSLSLKEKLSKKRQLLLKVSKTTEFNLYENEGRVFASPLDVEVFLERGMSPEAIAGEFLKGRENISPENFSLNPVFMKFLQWVISKYIPQYPGLEAVLSQKLSGESPIADLRGMKENGEVTEMDCLGVVEFVDGKIRSYSGNDTYKPFSEKGYMQLDPWFHEKYMYELSELQLGQVPSNRQS